MFPGEIRIWQDCFLNEFPEAVAWGFREYFRNGGNEGYSGPPKPVDVSRLIRINRESPYFAGWSADLQPAQQRRAATLQDYEMAQTSRQKFFESPEYKAFLERMKKEHNL